MRRPHPRGQDLSAYLDGALAARRVRRVEAHVAACIPCTEELTALRAAKLALADLPLPDPDPRWLPQVGELIAGGATPRRTHVMLRRVQRGAVVLGLVAATVGIVAWLAPPPEAPVSFQDQIRRHLVQLDEPLSDQTSYVVEARYP